MTEVTNTTAKRVTKTTVARRVFRQMYPQVLKGKRTRVEVIQRLVEKAELTPKGAATYYQRLKREFNNREAAS